MWRWFGAGVFLGVILPAALGIAFFRWWQGTDRIAFGVKVQGIAIGGLSRQQAKQVLRSHFHAALWANISVPLLCRGKIVHRIRIAELGLRPDLDKVVDEAGQIGRCASLLESLRQFLLAQQGGVHLPMRWRWEEDAARSLLHRLAGSLNRPPERAWVEWRDGAIHLVPSKEGVQVDIDATLRVWRHQFHQGKWERLEILLRPWHPEVTTEDVAMLDGVVGRAITSFRTSARNRAHNIRLAASRLDHVLIRPGEVLSFNALVGPRTSRRGFRVARVLVRGEFTEDFGGGVCQVAGTLYLAGLRAGMEVVERHRHSRPVAYLPPGLDATVNFGSLDLKLRNPFPTPLYLRIFVKGGRLTVLILGKRQSGRIYRIVREVTRVGSFTEKVTYDPSLPKGVRKIDDKGSPGYRVRVWRWQVDNGVVTKRELISVDTYSPQSRRRREGLALPPTSTAPLETATHPSDSPTPVFPAGNDTSP